MVVCICLLVLGWTKEIVGLFAHEASPGRDKATIALAVVAIYAVDFAINAVQASDRSLVVDALPVSKQQLGSAWATRMVAVGHLIGYGVGTIHLREIWGDWLGDTQFKQLIWVAILALAGSQGLTSWAVKERILISRKDDGSKGAFKTVLQIFRTTWSLPPRIQAICWVQFWAWIGWFPFLFYSPTWVGETYFRYSASEDAKTNPDKLGEIGRVGSLSLVIFSCVTFAGSILMPLVLRTPDKGGKETPSKWNKFRPDLLTAWMAGHIIFGLTMLFAPAVRSLTAATVLVSLVGIPWALTCWAPFAFMGEEVNKLEGSGTTVEANGRRYQAVPGADEQDELHEDVDMQEFSPPSSPTMLRINHMRGDSIAHDSIDQAGSVGETSGIYLGILNLYTTLPQFIGSFIATIVFAIFEPGKSKILHEGASEGDAVADVPDSDDSGPNAIGICLFIGAICALGAAYATWRLKHVT